MRVFILGIDGLEYNFVEKYRLRNLKQVEYGKIDLSDMEEILTPVIWGSFVTGRVQLKRDVTTIKWDNKFVEFLKKVSVKIGLHKIKGKGKLIEKLGIAHRRDHTWEDYKEKGVKTIFDYAKNPISLHVPTINDRSEFRKTAPLLVEIIENRDKEYEYLRIFWKQFKEIRKEVYEKLNDNWDLFMVHFQLLDFLGHLYAGRPNIHLYKGYLAFDELVYKLKRKLEGVFFLIISDHGMKPLGRFGDHSEYGFWSSNIRLGLKNPKITDFYQIIIEKLRC